MRTARGRRARTAGFGPAARALTLAPVAPVAAAGPTALAAERMVIESFPAGETLAP